MAENIELIHESDRGCVLVAASMLESLLEQDLRREVSRNGMSNRYINHAFDANGPLGTFSAKILIAKGFGLINEQVFQDLMVIRKLRNQFAHSIDLASFADEKVIAKVNSLRVIKRVQENTKDLKRYSFSGNEEDASSGIPLDLKMQASGYVRYHKSMFCLAVYYLKVEMLNHSVARYERLFE